MYKFFIISFIILILGLRTEAQNNWVYSEKTEVLHEAVKILEVENGDFWILDSNNEYMPPQTIFQILDPAGELIAKHTIVYDTSDVFLSSNFTRLAPNMNLMIGQRRIKIDTGTTFNSKSYSIEIRQFNDSFQLTDTIVVVDSFPFIGTVHSLSKHDDSTAYFSNIYINHDLANTKTEFGTIQKGKLLLSEKTGGYFNQVARTIMDDGFIASCAFFQGKTVILDDSLNYFDSLNIFDIYSTHLSYILPLNDNYILFSNPILNEQGEFGVGYLVSLFDSTFNREKTKYFGITNPDLQHLNCIQRGLDYKYENHIYAAGFYPHPPGITSEPPFSSVIEVANLDSNLNIRWYKMYGGDAYYRPYTITATSDTGCIVGGYRYDTTGVRHRDFHVLKIGPNGESPLVDVDDEEPVPYDITVYPNPSSGLFMVRTGQRNSGLRLRMTDMQGKEVLSTALEREENQFDLSHLLPGTYLYSLFDKNRLLGSSQWVKM